MPVLTNWAEMPLLEALMAATMPAGVVALAAMAILVEGWLAVGVAMSALDPLAVAVKVITPLEAAPEL